MIASFGGGGFGGAAAKGGRPRTKDAAGDEATDQIIGLFPTPIMVCAGAIGAELIAALLSQVEDARTGANVRTGLLTHTPMARPQSHPNFIKVHEAIAPKLRAYGEALLGENLSWGLKEIWINRMEKDGAQKMHNHANSFVSGVVYLTECHPSAATTFHRHVGATSFLMDNMNERARVSPFNAPIFRVPAVSPGDMVLFPSYVMHEVPPNQGGLRATVSFNAVPERIDSWGYTLQFR